MPIPLDYARASEVFDRFMEDARIRLDHSTRHQTYQTVESVLRVFRRRLTIEEAIIFAGALPAVLRAVFVTDWPMDEPKRPFLSLADMNREVIEYRIHHDFSPPDAIEAIAAVLRPHVDPVAFERALAALPAEARTFWHAGP